MRRVRWIVERPRDGSPTASQIQAAVEALGGEFALIDVTPRERVEFPRYDRPTVLHGRRTLLHAAIAHPDYGRAVFFDPAAFRPSAYLSHWGELMLNADARVVSVDEARHENRSRALFARPDDDDKAFTGRVFERGELATTRIENDRLVIAPAREVDAEARFFIVDGEIVAESMFRPSVFDRVSLELRACAQAAAKRWAPARVFVLDVGRSEARSGIVEANCFNGSRLYAADAASIVERVSSVVLDL